MVEKREVDRDAQLAMLLKYKWQAEIERIVDKVKFMLFQAGNGQRMNNGGVSNDTGR